MKYIMMMHVPKGTGDYQIYNWSPEDFQAHMDFLNRYNADLKEAGEWVEAQGLTPPSEAKLVTARKDGTPATDGVFPESKEFLAGWWIVDVDNAERAYALAAKASAAPGPGGTPLNMAIEVRPIMSGPLPTEG